MTRRTTLLIVSVPLFCSGLLVLKASHAEAPIVGGDVVFAEKDGLVAVEAEHFYQQTKTEKRKFHLVTADQVPQTKPDGDGSHVGGASGGAYLEILPDTRRNHGDELIPGENFSPQPGRMAILRYKVHFSDPGRYYVWVRAYSTGSEDNGLHVGIDGQWPESGQRLQWCEGKRTWRWESKQRTEQEHCGEPHKIFLDIEQPGTHTIEFSMREDGFEFDKWLMTKQRTFARPDGVGPGSVLHAGQAPQPFPFVPAAAETADRDPDADDQTPNSLRLSARQFTLDGSGFYLDRDKWAAINPDVRKRASVGMTIPFPTGTYHVTLQAVGESDGQSTYTVYIDGEKVGQFQCPLGEQMFQEGRAFHQTWKDIPITEGAIVRVDAEVGSADGQESSRGRWASVNFEPADQETKARAEPLLAQQPASRSRPPARRSDSPTVPVSKVPLVLPREADGDGSIEISGQPMVWHKITVTLDGPYAHEQDNEPNPFTDHRMMVRFTHSDGTTYTAAGYFAADGDAANSSAESGTRWRAHFAPDRPGTWNYTVRFHTGPQAALDADASATPLAPFDSRRGTITVVPSDKRGRDLRASGRLRYVGKRYLQHAGSKRYFLKAGADAPETLLAYADFDNTVAGKPQKSPLKTWAPHVKDWSPGDPTWKGNKGKGLVGAINYLSGKGCNAFSFLTYNAGGDGDNVWPFIHRDDKLHYDCSKLDQWSIVFDHATSRGMYLHFKMQETEMDDHDRGHQGQGGFVPTSLDGGNLGAQRKLYCRELIARFGHNLALNWNLGEENTQSTRQQTEMIDYIADLDPYDHNIVIHTFPNQQDKVYRPLLGPDSKLTGLSLQNSGIQDTHVQTVKWVRLSTEAGKPWVVAFDESGSAAHGQCPDLGYRGFDGRDQSGKMIYDEHAVRRQTLWGTLMGGGAGVEYYFGYQFVENDLVCEDWRSRDRSWDYCRIAIDFFRDLDIPIERTVPADELIGNNQHDNSKYCLAIPGELYLVYLPHGGQTELDLSGADGQFTQSLLNPRSGEITQRPDQVTGGGSQVTVGSPADDEDWLVMLRRR